VNCQSYPKNSWNHPCCHQGLERIKFVNSTFSRLSQVTAKFAAFFGWTNWCFESDKMYRVPTPRETKASSFYSTSALTPKIFALLPPNLKISKLNPPIPSTKFLMLMKHIRMLMKKWNSSSAEKDVPPPLKPPESTASLFVHLFRLTLHCGKDYGEDSTVILQ